MMKKKRKSKKLTRIPVPGQSEKTKMGMSVNELNFVNAYKRLGSYSAACREAYPNVKDSNNYGYAVAKRPHVKAKIDAFKAEIDAAIDDRWFVHNYVNIAENSLFKKIILKKKKTIRYDEGALDKDGEPKADEVHEEEQEVDQTNLGLQALNSLAKFKKGNEQAMINAGSLNVSIVLDNRILNVNEKKILEDPPDEDDQQIIIDI